jgi:hypothetical protein
MGDLNYRIDLDPKAVQEFLENNDIESMLENDQFIMEQLIGLDIDNFFEGKIEFLPTYKFKIGSDNYDFSDRIPSWTDRIIYKSKLNYDLIQLEYKTINEIRTSDHKPVLSVFKILLDEKNTNTSEDYKLAELPNSFANAVENINGSPVSNNKSSVCLIF